MKMEYLPGEVAQKLAIAPATLRLWSNKFSEFLSSGAGSRNGKNRIQRRYTEEDLECLKQIKFLLGQGKTYSQALHQIKEQSPGSKTPKPSNTEPALLSIFTHLKGRLAELPPKQSQLAQAMLRTPEIFVFGSVREISSQLNVNIATVVRFAQELGYSGYQALQADIRQAYLKQAGLNPPRDPAALL
jgi:DNA-binding transcriptional MerR regulator